MSSRRLLNPLPLRSPRAVVTERDTSCGVKRQRANVSYACLLRHPVAEPAAGALRVVISYLYPFFTPPKGLIDRCGSILSRSSSSTISFGIATVASSEGSTRPRASPSTPQSHPHQPIPFDFTSLARWPTYVDSQKLRQIVWTNITITESARRPSTRLPATSILRTRSRRSARGRLSRITSSRPVWLWESSSIPTRSLRTTSRVRTITRSLRAAARSIWSALRRAISTTANVLPAATWRILSGQRNGWRSGDLCRYHGCPGVLLLHGYVDLISRDGV